MKQTILTEKGLEKLKAKFEKLQVKRAETVLAIKDAQENNNCDLAENAEYLDASAEMNRIEHSMSEIKEKLSTARVVPLSSIVDDGKVKFGATVKLLLLDTETEMTFQVVGIEESDIKEGLLSYAAPLAKEMMGMEEGDVVECSDREYEILQVSIV